MIKTYVLCTDILTEKSVFIDYYRKLSTDRRFKTDQFHFQKDKMLCVGAGILMDKGLQEYGLHEADWSWHVTGAGSV